MKRGLVDPSTLAATVAHISGDFGIIVHDLARDVGAVLNRDAVFPTASLFKLLLLVELFSQAERGRLNLNDTCEYREVDRTPGSGILKTLTPGIKLKLRDLAALMTVVSDNAATDMLWRRLGGAHAMADCAARLGLASTATPLSAYQLLAHAVGLDPDERHPENTDAIAGRLRREEFDYQGLSFRRDRSNNSTTPGDMMALFSALERRVAASPESCDEILTILSAQQISDRIPLLLPKWIRVAHKTGTLATTRNDVGIVYLEDGSPLVLCVLSAGVPTQDGVDADRSIAQASRVVFDAANAVRRSES